jgi:lysozyme
MRKTIFIIIITLLVTSCEMKIKKTNKQDSLLDCGFLEESAVSTEKLTSKPEEFKSVSNTFKSKSNIHYGIDISHFQGDIVKTLKESNILSFVICKATQGEYFVDPDFRSNWKEIKEKGLIRGTYHFYDCSVSPKIQADHFVSTIVGIDANDIAPILDIEEGSMSKGISGEKMVRDILIFLTEVERKLNRKPMLYTDYAFAQEYFKNSKYSSVLAEYDLWLAEYSGKETARIPETWKHKGYKMWQKSASYHEGSQMVDHDEYSGLLKEIVK